MSNIRTPSSTNSSMSQKIDLVTLNKFLKSRNEKLIKYMRKAEAYSNLVFLITTDKNKYIFKQYTNVSRKNENEILKQIEKPKIFEMGDNYRIDEYIEHKKIDFWKDYDEIAKASTR